MFRVFLEGAQRHTRSRAAHVSRSYQDAHIGLDLAASGCLHTDSTAHRRVTRRSERHSFRAPHLASFSPLKGKPWAGDSGAGTGRETADPVL
jgi:hypothetical protein